MRESRRCSGIVLQTLEDMVNIADRTDQGMELREADGEGLGDRNEERIREE